MTVHRDAVELLKQAADERHTTVARRKLLEELSRRLDDLATEITADLQKDLRVAATQLRARAGAPMSFEETRTYSSLLDKVRGHLLAATGAGLTFQGSFTQPRIAEPAYGGHASAMGPPPVDPRAATSSGPSPVQFEEPVHLPVKTYAGSQSKDHLLESGGSGVALFDADGDGLLDIYLVNAFELNAQRERIPHRNVLLRNLGNWKFEDVSAAAGVDAVSWGNGVCVADYDDDGDLDLYVTNYGPNFLFRNNGRGAFTNTAPAAGVEASGWSTGCTFFDSDADGDLDLYVARYVQTTWQDVVNAKKTLVWRGGPKTMVGPVGLPGEADLFFENRGDGTFEDATERRGLADRSKAYGFGVVATDYDADGWVDLYVANDTNLNFLYHNRGDGRFESVGLAAGVALNAEGRAQAGMGVDSGDYDGDGRLDLIVTNFAHDTDTLYRNIDGGQFEDVTQAAGLASTFVPMGWGVAFLDLDLDGDLDLLKANGHIYPDVDSFPALKETFRQRNELLLNEGGWFRDVSSLAGAGLQIAKSSRGLAAGDLDGDGDLDAVVSNVDDEPTVIQNKQQTGHRWIALRLEKPGRNRFCIGARVTIDAGGRRQVREIRSGSSYLSQHDLRATFGLGTYAGTVDVEVQMPGGKRWRWTKLVTNRAVTLALTNDHQTPDHEP